MNLDALIPQRLAFTLEAIQDMTGIPVEQLEGAIKAGDLSARYADAEPVILRGSLVHWVNTLHEWEIEQASTAREDEIQTLRRQLDDLEHQIMSDDPFLPGGVIRRHSACIAHPVGKTYVLKDLYIMRCERYIKIGVSKNVDSRLKQIKRGGSMSPIGMDYTATELIHVSPKAGTATEQSLHAKFAHLRHTGEWFTAAPELTEYIESLTKEQAA